MIELPFPPASLSGHAKGHWRSKSDPTAKYRLWAKHATLAAKPDVPEEGDILVFVTFVPPDNRGDRVNFPNRCKPIFDGIADALGVNDKRFLPRYRFCKPEKPGRLEVRLGVPSPVPPALDELNGFARQVALDAIKHAPDNTDLKRRILLAREWGLLSDDETEEWIGMFGVKHD